MKRRQFVKLAEKSLELYNQETTVSKCACGADLRAYRFARGAGVPQIQRTFGQSGPALLRRVQNWAARTSTSFCADSCTKYHVGLKNPLFWEFFRGTSPVDYMDAPHNINEAIARHVECDLAAFERGYRDGNEVWVAGNNPSDQVRVDALVKAEHARREALARRRF